MSLLSASHSFSISLDKEMVNNFCRPEFMPNSFKCFCSNDFSRRQYLDNFSFNLKKPNSSSLPFTRIQSASTGIPSEAHVASENLKENVEIINPDEHSSIYTACVDYCAQELKTRFNAQNFPIQERHRLLLSNDGKCFSRSTALTAPKIRFMRSADIYAGSALQVLNLVIFPEIEYDFPYFCADLVTSPRGHLIILDLNPQYLTKEYNELYCKPFLPICKKFIQNFPWGGEFTAEAIEFFSPALIWSRLPLSQDITQTVFDAFKEYLDAWLDMVEVAKPATDASIIAKNKEAQHKYMSWRIEKDPGRPVLTRLFGSDRCEDYILKFLFHGYDEMGEKTFLDYFPQYRKLDGKLNERRSVTGRKFSTRPWDEDGNFIIQHAD